MDKDSKQWQSLTAWIHNVLGISYYIYNVYWGIGAVGLTATTVATVYRDKPSTLEHVGLYLGMIIFSGLIAQSLYLWHTYTEKALASYNPNLYQLKVENTYIIVNKTKRIFKKKARVKALSNGVEKYVIKFWWPGNGELTPKVNYPNDQISISRDPHSPKMMCVITFAKPLNKGEERTVEFEISQQYIKGETPPPYFYHVSCSRVGELVLRVIFRSKNHPESYKRQTLINVSAETSLNSELKAFSAGTAVLKKKRPRLGYCYKISWTNRTNK